MKKEDLIKGFILTSENANDHFKIAELLSRERMFGLALSHLILSAEESIKAMYISMQFFNITISTEDMKKLFTDHKTKHKKIQIGNNTIKKMIIGFLEEVSEGDEVIKKDFEEIKTTIKRTNYKILDNANFIKNKGFYVDYSNNDFSSPRQIKEKEYKTFYQIAWELIIVNGIINIKLKNTSANTA